MTTSTPAAARSRCHGHPQWTPTTSTRFPRARSPRFAVGDTVRVRDLHFAGHSRCPGYVRGRCGVVARIEVAAPIPEVEAHRRERVLDPTYGVRFDAAELWSDAAEANAPVHVDLYEQYLEPVT